MKKLLAIVLALMMVASMSVNAFAAAGFTKSPSKNMAPIFVDFSPKDEDCTSALVITGYADRNNLPQDLLDQINNAYQSIVDSGDLSKLLLQLEAYVEQNNIDGKNLAVSDLFNLHTEGCDNHENHKEFNVTLDADTLKNFVGLMYMDAEGNWHWVADAKVVNDGEHLQFTGMGSGAYAIVVDTTEDVTAGTGDTSTIIICAAVMAVAAVALVIVLIKGKKQKAEN